jgi:hypothetical protein
LRTPADRSPDELPPRANRAICPLRIKNAGETPFGFQRICLRVGHLAVYSDGKRMWTNAVTITDPGPGELAQIDYSKTAPEGRRKMTLLTEATIPPATGIVQRSFKTLRSLSTIAF